MPIYRYRCKACGAVAEVFAKVSDAAPAECSHCGANALEKMVSRTAFKLEGGGWYAQGYAGSSIRVHHHRMGQSRPRPVRRAMTDAHWARPTALSLHFIVLIL